MKKISLNQKNNLAFTLIELLAVIVILAIIALIATPIVLNIIEKARKSAFQDTAYGLIETARLEYTEGILDGDYIAKTYTAPFNDLKFSGSKPSGGTVVVGSDGKIAIAIHNNKWCAVKEYEETVVRMIHYEEESCKITGVIPKPVEKGTSFEEQMAKQSDQVMTNDPDGNKRYVGSNPNNYVSFNNELWRIIGIFDGQAKIIRNDPYGENRAWDNTSTHGNHGWNDWSQASLQIELNTTYLNSINEISKTYVDESHVWKLGGFSSITKDWTRANLYSLERATKVYSGRPTEWTGAIALMYPSDYGYATNSINNDCDSTTMYSWSNQSDCASNSWLKNDSESQWILSARSDHASGVYNVTKVGNLFYPYADDTTVSVRPVLYLKPTVKIKSGTGTSDDPFILKSNS